MATNTLFEALFINTLFLMHTYRKKWAYFFFLNDISNILAFSQLNQEDFDKFQDGLNDVITYIKSEQKTEEIKTKEYSAVSFEDLETKSEE